MERAELNHRDLDSIITTVESLNDDVRKKPAEQHEENVYEQGTVSTPQSLRKDYAFIREIGHGGQAKVYLARRLKDNKLVSVKQLNIDSVKAWKEYELFHREAEVLSHLNVQGVARFYDAIECLEDRPACSYIIQEFVEGASLAKMIKDGHRFTTSEVYDILLQMLNILRQLQNMDPPVIHRDIKPSNIMISPKKDGSYKVTLIDFGAVANPQVQSGGSTVAGTYGYMPPEQLMGRPQPASDIYSLGAVAIELFSGISPAQIQVKDFRLIFEPHVQQLPVAVVNTLRRMLEPKAEDRLSNLSELITTFKNYKNENYDNNALVSVKANKSRQLNKQLLEVQSIGNPGNMDLWQGLPDNLPREVPEVLVDYVDKYAVPDKANGNTGKSWSDRHPYMHTYIIVCIVIMFLLCVLLGSIAFAVVPPFAIVAIVIGSIAYSDESEEGTSGTTISGLVQNRQALSELIVNGRKTVATIVDIDYLPIPDNRNVDWEHDLLVAKTRPSFRVKYSFNPPDDKRESDLVHEYIAHSSPDEFYHKGDPLPILYKIDETYFGETVVSMPYPFPVDDNDLDDVVFSSNAYDAAASVSKDSYEYRQKVEPMLKARNRKDLIDAIDQKVWLIDEVESFRAVLDFAKRKILNTNDSEMRRKLMNAFVRIHHYAKIQSTRSEVESFVVKYLSGKYEGFKPTIEELKTVRSGSYELPEICRNIRMRFDSLNQMISAMDLSKEACLRMVLEEANWKDYVYIDDTILREEVDTMMIEEMRTIPEQYLNSCYEELNLKEFYRKKEMTMNLGSYDYRKHYKDFLDLIQHPRTTSNREQLMRQIDSDLWLVDRLDVTKGILKIGMEYIWPTDDTELRCHFMRTLLKIYHYANQKETQPYLIKFIVCYLTNKIQDVKPCADEIRELYKYGRDDLPPEVDSAVKRFYRS